MQAKKAAELQVGDTFCRGFDGDAVPRRDAIFTVERVQFIPIHDFFGKTMDTIQIIAKNHLLGPAKLDLTADETVWLVEAPQQSPSPTGDRRATGAGRWSLRRRS